MIGTGNAQPRNYSGRIDRRSGVPFYAQLRAILLSRLDDEWAPGGKLPSEAALCSQYGLSRTVVRQAMDQLALDGLIRKVNGVGTFVAQQRVGTGFVQRAAGFYDEMFARGHEVSSSTLQQVVHPASVLMSSQLEIAIGTPVLQFDRVRFIDGVSCQVVRTQLPIGRFPGLEDRDMTDRSLYAVLAQEYECRPCSGQRVIRSRLVDETDAQLLQVPLGSPVLVMQSLTKDDQGVPFEWYVASYRADQFQFEIELMTT